MLHLAFKGLFRFSLANAELDGQPNQKDEGEKNAGSKEGLIPACMRSEARHKEDERQESGAAGRSADERCSCVRQSLLPDASVPEFQKVRVFAPDAAHPFRDLHEHIDKRFRRKLLIAIALEETWRRTTPEV